MSEAASIPVKDIKAEPVSFQVNVLRQCERVAFYITQASRTLTTSDCFALGGSAKALESLLKPFSTEAYEEEAEKIKKDIETLEGYLKKENRQPRKKYVDRVIDWYSLLIEQLNNVGVVAKPRKTLMALSKQDYKRLGEELFGKGKIEIKFLEVVEAVELEKSESVGNADTTGFNKRFNKPRS